MELDRDKNILKETHKPVSLSKSNMSKRTRWGQNVNQHGTSEYQGGEEKVNPCGAQQVFQGGDHQVFKGGDHQVLQGGSHQVFKAPATSPLERRHTARSHLGRRLLGKHEVGAFFVCFSDFFLLHKSETAPQNPVVFSHLISDSSFRLLVLSHLRQICHHNLEFVSRQKITLVGI